MGCHINGCNMTGVFAMRALHTQLSIDFIISSQFVALGLQVSFIQCDLIAVQKTSSVAGSCVGWNVPNRRSHIVVLMPNRRIRT
jgi:hypothetical protein